MRAPVLHEVTCLRKASAASLACKRLFPRMYTEMLVQIGVPLKHFLAHLAFIARTYEQLMLFEVPLKLKLPSAPLAAEVTLVWPLRMQTDVSHEVAPIRKIPVTHRTREWFEATVQQHVPFEAARTRKGHITEITLETFDSSVYTLMVLAVLAALEILATIRTNETGRHAVVLWL